MPETALGNRCDDSAHQSFVFDRGAGVCFCPGTVTAMNGVATCAHDGPDEIGEAPVAASSSTSTGTETTVSLADEAHQKAAARVDHLGSAGAATVAIGVCAQGANKLAKNRAAGGLVIGSCLEAIGAAERLKESEKAALARAGEDGHDQSLEVNPELFADAEFRKQAAELKENYGVGDRDFVAKALATKGNRAAFGRILKSRFSASEFREALESGDKLVDPERSKVLAALKAIPKVSENVYAMAAKSEYDALRSNLYDSLHSASSYSPQAAETVAARRAATAASPAEDGAEQLGRLSKGPEALMGMHAFDTSVITGAEEAAEVELTIFDVVHRKYHDKELVRKVTLRPYGGI